MRQERIRKEHAGNGAASREGVPCSHQEMYELSQQSLAEHSTIASEHVRRLHKWSDEQHRIAQEKGANGR